MELRGARRAVRHVEEVKDRCALLQQGVAIGWLRHEPGYVAHKGLHILPNDGAVRGVSEPGEITAHPQQRPDDAGFVRSVTPNLSEGQIDEIGEVAGRDVEPDRTLGVCHCSRAVLPECKRGEDRAQMVDRLVRRVWVINSWRERLGRDVRELSDPERDVLLQGPFVADAYTLR